MSLPVLNVIGKPGHHDPAAVQVLIGKADFPEDRLPNNKYYGAIRPSNITRGKITSIDGSEALKLSGVKAVVDYNDIPGWSDNVLYWGQPVAGVIADDPYTAERALTLIKIEYARGNAVVDPDEAIEPGAPLSGIRPETNVNRQTNLERGNWDAGLAAADVVEDTSFGWTTIHQHNCLEPHSATAWWIGDDCYVWAACQNVFSAKNSIVNAFGMSAAKVHFYSHFTGSALGDKTGAPVAPVAVAMSKVVNGYPVQIVESRKVNILTNSRQFQVRSTFKLGAKNDGTFTGADATWWAMGGVNASTPSGNANFGFRTTYTIPDARMIVNLISTNSPARGYYRCVCDPPGNINADSAIDKLAVKLNMDPYELRMKNIRPANAADLDSPNRQWGNGGAGVGVRMCFEKVYEESGYASKKHAPGQRTVDGKLHGIAITGHLDSHGGVNGGSRGAMVTMTADGKCLINMGGARATPSAPTMCCHMAAETLGLLYSDVNVGEWGNADVSLDAGGQNGSGFTGGTGSAFIRAAEDARAKVFAAAITKAGLKEISGITVNDLDAKDSEIFYKPDPTKRITYRQAMSGTPPIAGSAVGWNPATEGGRNGIQRTRDGLPPVGTAVNTNGGAATCAEVAVDPDTGEVEILGLWNAIDTGRTICKYGATKEINSGGEILIWMCMYAGDVFDPTTAALIGTHYDETMHMTTMDVDVTKIHPYDIESDDMGGPYGAHGIGEPANTNVSAVVNAIYNAIGEWVNPRGGPITPDIVLNALGKATISTNLFSR